MRRWRNLTMQLSKVQQFIEEIATLKKLKAEDSKRRKVFLLSAFKEAILHPNGPLKNANYDLFITKSTDRVSRLYRLHRTITETSLSLSITRFNNRN